MFLLDLYSDVLDRIISYLHFDDWSSARLTCKMLSNICDDEAAQLIPRLNKIITSERSTIGITKNLLERYIRYHHLTVSVTTINNQGPDQDVASLNRMDKIVQSLFESDCDIQDTTICSPKEPVISVCFSIRWQLIAVLTAVSLSIYDTSNTIIKYITGKFVQMSASEWSSYWVLTLLEDDGLNQGYSLKVLISDSNLVSEIPQEDRRYLRLTSSGAVDTQNTSWVTDDSLPYVNQIKDTDVYYSDWIHSLNKDRSKILGLCTEYEGEWKFFTSSMLMTIGVDTDGKAYLLRNGKKEHLNNSVDVVDVWVEQGLFCNYILLYRNGDLVLYPDFTDDSIKIASNVHSFSVPTCGYSRNVLITQWSNNS